MQKTYEKWVQSLGQEDPLEEGKANYYLSLYYGQYYCQENPMDK